jgi:hypothetical protein
VSVTPPVKIHIIRRGSGQVKVEPPVVHLGADQGFSVANHTDLSAEVTFDRAVTPVSQAIPPRSTRPFTAGGGPDYTEYDVVLTGGFKAEGNSRPGAIIDP